MARRRAGKRLRATALGLLAAVCFAQVGSAQAGRRIPLQGRPVAPSPAAIPPATADVLVEMAGHAAVVFVGQVISVTRQDSAGFVDVRFHIDQAVRGCPANGAYVLREWAGLWTANPDRFHSGQRFLMLLTARGPSGMSAPVGGSDGAIPIVATAAAPLANAAGVAPAEDGTVASAQTVDLRWIQARAFRASPLTPGPTALMAATVEGDPAIGTWPGPTGVLYPARDGGAAARTSSLSAVLTLVGGVTGSPHVSK